MIESLYYIIRFAERFGEVANLISSLEELSSLLQSGVHIDVDALSEEDLNQSFDFLNQRMTIIYQFVLAYNEYLNTRHSYLPDYALTTLEAHLLTDICDYPDSTVTSLANAWNRSVSATSQTVGKLIKKDLVTRENSTKNAKIFYLRPTSKGIEISNAHKRYDVLDTIRTYKTLLHSLSTEELKAMHISLRAFTELLLKNK